MISYAEALVLIAQEAQLQPVRLVERNAALGHLAADDIRARFDIPPFHNSAMDGFALRAIQTAGASGQTPQRIRVSHCIAAGDVLDNPDPNLAVEIMTGAKMPEGFDCVVPIEKVRVIQGDNGHTAEIDLQSAQGVGDNVRYAGEDFKCGQVIATPGTRLHAGHMAAMAATGLHAVPVFTMPEVAVLTTGKEVSDAYHVPLQAGEIYNSNTPYLLADLAQAGIAALDAGNVGEDAQLFVDTLNATQNARIVISTGAVSMGKWDFIAELLEQQGARIIFHGVGIKPGKPILFAVLNDGRYYFGLPGNPVSTAVGLRFFVQPLIGQLLGMPEAHCWGVALAHNFHKKGNFRQFLKARLAPDEHGQMRLSILDGQESFKISPLLNMNCWAILGEDQNDLKQGDMVRIASMALFPTVF